MASKPFELRVEADQPSQYGLALYRKPARGENRNGDSADWQLVVRVIGTPMQAMMDQFLSTIRQAGYRPSDLSRSRKTPFHLDEERGVRIGLAMLAVKPLRKTSRMSEVSEQIQGMAAEEAYYWFSKATDHQFGRRSQKALRVLLSQE